MHSILDGCGWSFRQWLATSLLYRTPFPLEEFSAPPFLYQMCGWAGSQLKRLPSLLVPKMPPWIHIWESHWAARASGREPFHLSLGVVRIEGSLIGLQWGSTLNSWQPLGPMADAETWCGRETQAAWGSTWKWREKGRRAHLHFLSPDPSVASP